MKKNKPIFYVALALIQGALPPLCGTYKPRSSLLHIEQFFIFHDCDPKVSPHFVDGQPKASCKWWSMSP